MEDKMPFFEDKTVVEKLFGELWRKMIDETEFGPKIKSQGISISYTIDTPDVVMYIDADGPLFGAEAKAKTPMVTMKMTGDDVHRFWLKKLNVPKAMALRKIRAKGPVGKILQLLPLLKPGMAMYPDYCKAYNLPVDI
jgi:putative sterol carrier protein